jgi:hypothetical protein
MFTHQESYIINSVSITRSPTSSYEGRRGGALRNITGIVRQRNHGVNLIDVHFGKAGERDPMLEIEFDRQVYSMAIYAPSRSFVYICEV